MRQLAMTDAEGDFVPTALEHKISILPGAEQDLSAVTFCIMDEDHTLGNVLRWMIMKDPQVEFCGYSIPHPSESKIHLRIQMYDRRSSIKALRSALSNLNELFLSIGTAYERDYAAGNFERYEEPQLDLDQLRLDAAEGRRRRAEAQQEKKSKDISQRAKA
ncbi:RBP11-like subunits of RNA polymerase [Tilletiaria anomala UBC 951]|uniref:DNA-directed RNA polymerases I and III subunit RPAC2 n=1 Tax=Tilletiaria anomala (strain ATCC 24038 / CBS 436.72 / UBC 951) TaxID=1037660 RepID=A0A066WES0_TILAU|nr:RBP11-like subunits of RNA polymerase [Tilletiaria anomala UBC 951]KDN52256.1 RBP11-like subunits of RNA polymerase [Tilletiaria anomala UBC 951]